MRPVFTPDGFNVSDGRQMRLDDFNVSSIKKLENLILALHGRVLSACKDMSVCLRKIYAVVTSQE